MLEPDKLAELVARARLRDHPPAADTTDADAFIGAAVDEIENLRGAVAHRTTIGQATGILMERFGLDADTAFATLAQLSQETNRKLYDIADELAHETRTPAAVPDPGTDGLRPTRRPSEATQQTA